MTEEQSEFLAGFMLMIVQQYAQSSGGFIPEEDFIKSRDMMGLKELKIRTN